MSVQHFEIAKILKNFDISKFQKEIYSKILVFQDNLHKFAEKNAENLQKSKIFIYYGLNSTYTFGIL